MKALLKWLGAWIFVIVFAYGVNAAANRIYPDPTLTPGATDPRVTQGTIDATICVPGYTKTVRPPLEVTSVLKKRIMRKYGLTDSPSHYELDHLISLEIGGCPACVTNLWPESYLGPVNARTKDLVENWLHKEICAGHITLEEAQHKIVADWYAVYQQMPKEEKK